MTSFNRHELRQELGFVDIEPAAAGRPKSPRTDLSCSGMVVHGDVPCRFDAGTSGRNAAARFASHDDLLKSERVQVYGMFGSDFGQMQCIGGCAAKDRDLRMLNEFQSGEAAESAARDDEHAASCECIECAPETYKWAEGESQQGPVVGRYVGRIEHVLPGFDPPLPIIGRVKYAQRSPARARCLMEADTAIDFVGSVRGKILAARLWQQLLFVGERKRRELIEAIEPFGTADQLTLIEAIVRPRILEQLVELFELKLGECSPIQLLNALPLFEGGHGHR